MVCNVLGKRLLYRSEASRKTRIPKDFIELFSQGSDLIHLSDSNFQTWREAHGRSSIIE
jgi:hypothetical protein